MLFYNKFLIVGLYISIVVLVAALILLIAFVTSVSAPDSEKFSTYECGFDPYEDTRNNFDVKFYLVAVLFLIFDLETCFFFPYSCSISFLNSNSLFSIFDFIFELVVGFVYAWKMGALEWE